MLPSYIALKMTRTFVLKWRLSLLAYSAGYNVCFSQRMEINMLHLFHQRQDEIKL